MDITNLNFPGGIIQDRNWPLPKFHFAVRFGYEIWSFQEIGNLSTSVNVLKHRHGRSGQTGVYKIPGMQEVEDVTLKKGMFTGDTFLFEWFKSTRTKDPMRMDVSIYLLNQFSIPEIIWSLTNAFPVKIEGGNLDSKATGDGAVAIESLTLTFEEMEVEDLLKMGIRMAAKL